MKNNDTEKRRKTIRNSTVDFLVFTKDAGEDSIEVRVQDGEVWLTQDGIAQLFDVDRSVVTKHLKNIFQDGELTEEATRAKFAQVADNGKTYQYNHCGGVPHQFFQSSAVPTVGNEGVGNLYETGICAGQGAADQRSDL